MKALHFYLPPRVEGVSMVETVRNRIPNFDGRSRYRSRVPIYEAYLSAGKTDSGLNVHITIQDAPTA